MEIPLEKRLGRLEEKVERLEKKKKSMSLVCFSCEYDKLYAAFNIAVGAATMGVEVKMFFSFWGAKAMEQEFGSSCGHSWFERAFSRCAPRKVSSLPLSRMNLCGLGSFFLKKLMRRKHIEGLESLIASARELDVSFYLCEKSAEMMGLSSCDGEQAQECGVASFVAKALEDSIVLFI